MEIKDILSKVKELSEVRNRDKIVLNIIEENKGLISKKLVFPNDEYLDALQIVSIQCLILADKQNVSGLEEQLPYVLQKWNDLPIPEDEKMKSNMYEKLVFHKMNLACKNRDWQNAREIANDLLKYFPSNSTYVEWKNGIDKKSRGSLRNLKSLSIVLKLIGAVYLIGVWFFNVGSEWAKVIRVVVPMIIILIIVIIDILIKKRDSF